MSEFVKQTVEFREHSKLKLRRNESRERPLTPRSYTDELEITEADVALATNLKKGDRDGIRKE